ncbi:MAG: preprotein translocase subunit SecG [Bacteriovoracales bacterium]|nr:preprotein translocase subunit SecG [Bacteriovoracales bacterium]
MALTITHVVVSILLIIVVLLQFGRGAEAGFFSDTSSQGVFAGPGPGNLLGRATTFLSVIFLALALLLANLRGKGRGASLFDDEAAPINTMKEGGPKGQEGGIAVPSGEKPSAGQGPEQEQGPESQTSPAPSPQN